MALPSGSKGGTRDRSAGVSVVMRPCAGRCGSLVESGRCAACRAKVEAHRGKTAERGYDARFRALRVPCFERDGWRCVDCGWQPDIVRRFHDAGVPDLPSPALVLKELRARFAMGETHLHADHQIQIDVAPGLRLELSNLRTRCNVCHSRKTREEHATEFVCA